MALTDVIEAFRSHQRFLVTPHQNPDGDAVGAALATAALLRDHLGKEAIAVTPDPIVDRYRFLPGLDELRTPAEAAALGPYDAAVTVDVSTGERVGDVSSLIDPAMTSINIDHHVTNPRNADACWVDDDAASTCEMIVDIYQTLDAVPGADIATALYTGIMTDTGQFAFRGTTARSMRAAATLLDWGADYELAAREVYRKTTIDVVKVLGRVLNRVQMHDRDRLAVSWMEPDEIGVDHEGFVNHLLDIDTVEVAVLLRPLGNGDWKLSFRSAGRVDVAALAGFFQGGGHRMAAGGRFSGELLPTLEQVIKASTNAIQAACSPGSQA